MYPTTKKLSLFSLLLNMVNILFTILITVYISYSELEFTIQIAITFVLVTNTLFSIFTTIAIRSLRQELEWEYTDDSKTIRDLKARVHVLEEKVKEK